MTEEYRFKHIGALIRAFEMRYGGKPTIASRAPGRINLIGEHTDYNDGWVLPAAINYEINVVCRPRNDSLVRLVALDMGKESDFYLENHNRTDFLWLRYPQGVAVELQNRGYKLRGMEAVYMGDIPVGSGLSSSAAVEVAFVHAFCRAADIELSGEEVALIAQRAENDFVGVPCGVMDQFVSSLGRQDHALLLDSRSLEYQHIPINLPNVSLVILDTGVSRELAGSEYKKRRQDCEEAVTRLSTRISGIKALRDVTLEQLEENLDLLTSTQRKRARHVIEENMRTLEAAEALRNGDAAAIGRLMKESHISLRDLYEVSSFELDTIVEIAWDTDGVIGARMTGAGFGGVALALVHQDAVPTLYERVMQEYHARTGKEPKVFVCRAVDGAESALMEEVQVHSIWNV
ncbi:galactokinase [Thermobaculum terrenum ATCC BAA-798]|uniref:Galactokinase n=1 Tax=Thermobaculum terrenum (strain ATCC BAA-798 / CCMEE 7001 / YNP1) TaxID=525904 RepID=D1CEW6_THET1|nr:galactokinase [Thermobaculum terrenum]ACZ41472.1 galactokinase [Thermobaculum terrenum ATCC BAA-798]